MIPAFTEEALYTISSVGGNETWKVDAKDLMYARHSTFYELTIMSADRKYIGRWLEDRMAI